MLRRLWAKYVLWRNEICSVHFTRKQTGAKSGLLYCQECFVNGRNIDENDVERATRILKGEI